jgi:hypothetical protein
MLLIINLDKTSPNPTSWRYLNWCNALRMGPPNTVEERREVNDGREAWHLWQGLTDVFGFPQIGHIGGVISAVIRVHSPHHLAPETPQPPQLGGYNQSIASQNS